MEIFKYYNRSKRKWIVELKDKDNEKYVAESYICANKEEAEQSYNKIEEKYGYSWFYNWTAEKIIKDILTTHGIECNIVNGVSKKFKPMSYTPSENCITFNVDYIRRHCISNLFPIIEAVKVITYHEIGHYIDHKLHPYKKDILRNIRELDADEKLKFRIESELVAWKLSRYLVPDDLLLLFDDINETNMRIYDKQYQVLALKN